MKRTPGEELVELLEQFRERLNSSGVERTVGIRTQLGDDCPHYRKSLDLFVRKDYVDIRNLNQQLTELFKVVEGK